MTVSILSRGLTVAILSLALVGCRHRPQAAALPLPPQTPVPLAKTPEPKSPPLVATVPLQPAPQPSVTPLKRIRKLRKKVVPVVPPVTVVPAPSEVASAGPLPEANVIGALTPGGDSGPEKQKEASDLISDLEKRVAGLSKETKSKQREGLDRVKLFQRQAERALKGGDADGAVTLATKAKLLLDELLVK